MEVVKKTNNIKHICIGIVISMVITLIALFVLSAILTYTEISENIIKPAIILITGISILIGSSISNIKIKKMGILNGAIIGGGYLIILYLLSSIINTDFAFNIESIITIVVGVILGIFGGILGVNKRYKKGN